MLPHRYIHELQEVGNTEGTLRMNDIGRATFTTREALSVVGMVCYFSSKSNADAGFQVISPDGIKLSGRRSVLAVKWGCLTERLLVLAKFTVFLYSYLYGMH